MPGTLIAAERPFCITPSSRSTLKNVLLSAFKRPLGRMLRLEELNDRYAKVIAARETDPEQTTFLNGALEELGVTHEATPEDLARIPVSGALVMAANHPFGVVEGLVLARLLLSIRPDVKILANHLLAVIPEMRPLLISVDPFGGAGSKVRNLSGLREALAWLKAGGALLTFPAGEVASLSVGRRMVADPPWQRGVVALARKAGAPVLPVFIHGRNGALFQAAGLVHPRLRTLLLPRENLGRAGRSVRLSVGAPVTAEKLTAFASDQDACAYLRFRCHLLKNRPLADEIPGLHKGLRADPRQKALAAQRPFAARLSEVAALPPEAVLARSAPFVVFEAEASAIPNILHEIARLRESTFRRVGEGTGQALDTDRFDAHYRHLVLWNEADREVAGAYRFAATDEILSSQGARGMYLSSQFKIRGEFWDRVGPGLELGRSFVRPRYQKAYQPLMLLWKGLAEYIIRNPRYRTLFGCVSISGDYSPLSRELMVAFLRRHSFDSRLARLVKPKVLRAPRGGGLARLDLCIPEAVFHDPRDLAELVAELEQGRGIPVLLRQYLKLGGRIASFSVDPDFGNCLDGLIVVDLPAAGERTLARFMGSEAARAYLAHQSSTPQSGHTDHPNQTPPRLAA